VRSRSKTSEIEAELRRRIETRIYPPGGRLPRFSDLRAEFGVAKGTVDVVLARLEAAGLLIRIQGSGLYVRDRVVVERHLLDDVLTEFRLAVTGRASEAGLFEIVTGHDVVVDVAYEQQPASDRVAAMLHLEPGTPVLQRTFRYLLTGVSPAAPHQIAYGWMALDLAERAGLTDPSVERKGVGSMAQLIGAGVELVTAKRRIESRMPTLAESTELAIPPGTPVFELHRCLWQLAPPGPVEYGIQVIPADQVVWLVDIDLRGVQL